MRQPRRGSPNFPIWQHQHQRPPSHDEQLICLPTRLRRESLPSHNSSDRPECGGCESYRARALSRPGWKTARIGLTLLLQQSHHPAISLLLYASRTSPCTRFHIGKRKFECERYRPVVLRLMGRFWIESTTIYHLATVVHNTRKS